MRSNLTKKEIATVNTHVLNSRYCYLLQKGERIPAQEFSIAEAKEIIWIEDQLRINIIRAVGRDPYPPDRIEKQTPSNYMVSLLKSRQDKPEEKTEAKFSFKVTVTSSIGSVVAQQNVKVNSKSDADIVAQNMIDKLGLKGATYKIS